MGNNEPNLKIGTDDFFDSELVNYNETNICNNNCDLIEEKCGFFTSLLINLLKSYGENILNCPIK